MVFVHEYAQYCNGTVRDNGWWEWNNGRLVSPSGGYHEADPLENYKEIVERDSWEGLFKTDVYKNSLIIKDSEFGWLSPEGDFYSCEYTNHERLALYYFGKEEEQLENEGWAKITWSALDHILRVYNDGRLTNKQVTYLEDKGFKYVKYYWVKNPQE